MSLNANKSANKQANKSPTNDNGNIVLNPTNILKQSTINKQHSLSANKSTNKAINNISNDSSSITTTIGHKFANIFANIKSGSLKGVLPLIIMLITIIVLITFGFYSYHYYTNSAAQSSSTTSYTALSGVAAGTAPITINSANIPNSQFSNEYGISMWIKVNDYTYNYDQDKVLLRHGDKDNANPEILLTPYDNNLIVRIKLQRPSNNTILTKSNFENITNNNTENNNTENNNIENNMLENNENCKTCGHHEKFTESAYMFDNSDPKLSYIPDMTPISDNAANISNHYHDEVFNLISSDNAAVPKISTPSDMHYISSAIGMGAPNIPVIQMPQAPITINQHLENFDNNTATTATTTTVATLPQYDSIATILANILTQFCTLFNNMKNMDTASTTFATVDTAFTQFINMLDGLVNSSSTTTPIAGTTVTVQPSALDTLNNDLLTTFSNTISPDLQLINTYAGQLQNQSLQISTDAQYSAIATLVNSKLQNSGVSDKCPLLILNTSSASVSGLTLLESLIKMLKESLYTYIYNLGKVIAKNMPQLDTAAHARVSNDACVVRNIPLQKWVHIAIAQYNQNLDIYIDGLLSSSCILKGFPIISTNNATLCPDGGFDGKISNVVFYANALNSQDVHNIYNQGPTAETSIFSNIPQWIYISVGCILLIVIAFSMFT